MTAITFFLIFIPILALILLTINFIFAPHSPYQEKGSTFECGFHSFLGQNRTQFSISFFIFALLFLLFDLEILLVYPYVVSSYINNIYGLIIMLIFFLMLTLGFAFELGKNALKIESKQYNKNYNLQLVYISIPCFELELSDINLIFLCAIIFMISLAIVIILMSKPKYLNDHIKGTNIIEGSVADVIDKRYKCKHNWTPHFKEMVCNYTPDPSGDGCKLQNPINWRCIKCEEVRCGIHTEHLYPNCGPTPSRIP